MKLFEGTTAFVSTAEAVLLESLLLNLLESYRRIAQASTTPSTFCASICLTAGMLPKLLAEQEADTPVLHVLLPKEAGGHIPRLLDSPLSIFNTQVRPWGHADWATVWGMTSEQRHLLLNVDNTDLGQTLVKAAELGRLVLVLQTEEGLWMRLRTEQYLGAPDDLMMLFQANCSCASDLRKSRHPYLETLERDGTDDRCEPHYRTWEAEHFRYGPSAE